MKCIWCHTNESPEDEYEMCSQCFREMENKKKEKQIKGFQKDESASEWMKRFLHLD